MSIFACICHALHHLPSPLDLLLLFWPIFFVSAARHGPQLKGRNFRKSVARGAGHVRGATSITARARARPVKRSRKFAPREEQEDNPVWDTASTTSRQQVRFLRPRNNTALRSTAFVWLMLDMLAPQQDMPFSRMPCRTRF